MLHSNGQKFVNTQSFRGHPLDLHRSVVLRLNHGPYGRPLSHNAYRGELRVNTPPSLLSLSCWFAPLEDGYTPVPHTLRKVWRRYCLAYLKGDGAKGLQKADFIPNSIFQDSKHLATFVCRTGVTQVIVDLSSRVK